MTPRQRCSDLARPATTDAAAADRSTLRRSRTLARAATLIYFIYLILNLRGRGPGRGAARATDGDARRRARPRAFTFQLVPGLDRDYYTDDSAEYYVTTQLSSTSVHCSLYTYAHCVRFANTCIIYMRTGSLMSYMRSQRRPGQAMC